MHLKRVMLSKKIDEIVFWTWQYFKNSDKAKSMLMAIASQLNVLYVTFTRSHSTQFQNHKLMAIGALIINYISIVDFCENAIASGTDVCHGEVASKLKGFLKTFKSYKYLASLPFYHLTLKETAHLAYIMQSSSTLITDIVEPINNCKDKLEELQHHKVELPFEICLDESDKNIVIVQAQAINLPASMTFSANPRLTSKQTERYLKTFMR